MTDNNQGYAVGWLTLAFINAGLAMMVAQPGSASQRNAERQGFRTAYTRTKWCLAGPGA